MPVSLKLINTVPALVIHEVNPLVKVRAVILPKSMMCADSFGLPIDFELTGGEVHDAKVAPGLIDRLPTGGYVVADKGYDSEELRQQITEKKSIPIIPRKCNSTIGNGDMDWYLYKYRHLVENLFARFKHFRTIATRYDKLERNYESMLALAGGFLWLPM
uniref:Transposase n=1 Tax=Candidatus Kentrum sp. TC TaxID=2126339 RepID=A0A451A9I7_9GAMM|nr:MAG: Transposase [Candidatus Kentron sp. TC]